MESRRCIFVVDDEHDVREIVCELLCDAGFEVFGFASGRAVLEALDAGLTPDLFLLDLFMPDLSGGELAGELRRSCDTNRVPILFLSAAPHLVPEGLEVLGKPFDPAMLVRRAMELVVERASTASRVV